MDVAGWLDGLGLPQYAQAFRDNHIDGATLRQLTESDLHALGVRSVGHRRRLAVALAGLREPALETAPAPAPSARSGMPPWHAEHRQITVLYCDLVGSTALSEQMDPEDYRDLMRSFHDGCVRVVAEFDGWVANFIGDCVLAYFGWPRAHEDDPERAVRTGRALLEMVAAQGREVRVGLATGSAVVGDLIHAGPAQEQSAVGATPERAALLQMRANPGQLLVDDLTRQLTLGAFVLQPAEANDAPGEGGPVSAWAVAGEQSNESRFDARQGPRLAPLVGREQELALLSQRWAQARGGEGMALLLVGEAGIGKSRLVRALLDAVGSPPSSALRWQCSPYHAGSALWPVVRRLRRELGLDAGRSPDEALDRLDALVSGNREVSALYATLLGLDGSPRYGPLEMSPQRLRERTLEVLADELLGYSQGSPLLLVIEDAHWIDPTTLELVRRCLERIDGARMLMLVTTRPEGQPDLGGHPSVTRLSLNRLSRASAEALVARLAGNHLQAETLSTIVAQADGVPLFVEELTKAVLETGEAAIPASLYGSLMARLDRLADVKEVAQVAACIGREFDQALLQAVVDTPESVPAALEELAAAELIFRRGPGPNPRFTFKHALVQEAASASLLRARRQAIHARILHTLRAREAEVPPEILAHHAERARLTPLAIRYWRSAGHAALEKSAYREAASDLAKAIDHVKRLGGDPDPRRDTEELELLLWLGQADIASLGFAAAATMDVFTRADALLQADAAHLPQAQRVHYGLWAGYFTSANLQAAMDRARKSLADAQASGSADDLVCAHRLMACSFMFMGDFSRAREHFETALPLLDLVDLDDIAARFGWDPGVATYSYLAWLLHLQGEPTRSADMALRGRRITLSRPEASARAQLYLSLGLLGVSLGDHEAVRRDARDLADLSARHGLHYHRDWAAVFASWAMLDPERACDDRIDALLRDTAQLLAAGGRIIWCPILAVRLGFALAASGRHDEALRVVDDALDECRETAQGWCDAELWRAHGELQLRHPQGSAAVAERSYERALAAARERGARLWELRAAMSLARLWKGQGKRAEAVQLLEPIESRFNAGLASADFDDARKLLRELRR